VGINKIIGQRAKISSGEIEYCFSGKGPTVLVSHGTLGGFDQGLAISQLFNHDMFRFLPVSSHAVNDPLVSSEDAAKLAVHISGAEYHEIPDGGHIFFVVHSSRVIPDIERFLLANTPIC
jgi:hypothetical protein